MSSSPICVPLLCPQSVRELYELTKSDPGKYTVPVLWDKQLNTIVNNESSDLMRMLNTAFNGLPEVNSELDLYPSELRQQIDDVNEWIYHNINNGVYRCGFSRSQEAYDLAIEDLYSGARLVLILPVALGRPVTFGGVQ